MDPLEQFALYWAALELVEENERIKVEAKQAMQLIADAWRSFSDGLQKQIDALKKDIANVEADYGIELDNHKTTKAKLAAVEAERDKLAGKVKAAQSALSDLPKPGIDLFAQEAQRAIGGGILAGGYGNPMRPRGYSQGAVAGGAYPGFVGYPDGAPKVGPGWSAIAAGTDG